MKQKFVISLFVIGLVMLVTGVDVFGQDGFAPSENFSPAQQRTYYTPGGDDNPPSIGKTKTTSSNNSDSSTVKTVGRPHSTNNHPVTPKAESEDESVLSFNFLYYIIRKYKIQDIVD